MAQPTSPYESSIAGRERILAGVLKVARLPGEYQVADLGTKPFARARMFQLLELINIRSSGDATEAVKNARMLSRLSLTGTATVPLTAEALAGLALLAAIPVARAQPGSAETGVGSGLYEWVVGLCLGLVLFGVGSRLPWPISGELLASPRSALDEPEPSEQDPAFSESEGVQGGPPAEEGVEGSDASEFSPEEWTKAEAKLSAMERRTGLTFIQHSGGN